MPEELPALKNVLSSISILRCFEFKQYSLSCTQVLFTSPNAEEALSLLSLPLAPSRESIELATDKFLEIGVGEGKTGWVIIRSGPLGCYMKSQMTKGVWVDAYWTTKDNHKVVDVTGRFEPQHL